MDTAIQLAGRSFHLSLRVQLKRLVRPFREPSTGFAATLCLCDLALFLTLIAAVVSLQGMLLKLLASLALGLVIARLFIIGHDACHQAMFPDRHLNRIVGRLALLPTLTNYSLWEAGHNVGHHVYTNLSGYDVAWAPLSKADYDALPTWRRMLIRFYRSGWGHAPYYCIEVWWKTLLFPPSSSTGLRGPAVLRDALLLWGFAGLWLSGLTVAALLTEQSVALLILFGVLLPFTVWNLLIGTVTYFQHTHPEIVWYDDIDAWQAQRDGARDTVHVTFPGRLGFALNNIMEHPAHHLDVRIPLYRLGHAQRVLNEGETAFVEQQLSWQFMRECVNRCKLYDYEAKRWMDFSGNYTTAAPRAAQTEASTFVTALATPV